MTIIPENVLRLMSPADRKQLGKSGWTAEECQRRVDTKLERTMHAEFSGFLRRNRLLFVHADPSKKSTIEPGWPDYTIFGVAERVLFIEFKIGRNKLSEVQETIIFRLRDQGHVVHVCGDYATAVALAAGFFNLW